MMKMAFFRRIGRRLGATLHRAAPVEAYDRWAATYDAQPDNVVNPAYLLERQPAADLSGASVPCARDPAEVW